MQVLSIENVEKVKVGFDRDTAKADIFVRNQLLECLSWVVGDKAQLIKDHFGHLVTNRIFILRSYIWAIREHCVGLDTDLESCESDWDLCVSELKQVRMVAHFPQVHHNVHQVLNLLFVV